MNPLGTHRTPKTLICPHCGTQMNLTGRGRAPGSVVYLCRRCVPMLQMKELWLGQVVRTGNLGFGYVQVRGAHGLGGLRFELRHCLDAVSGRPSVPQIGDPVLVLLSDDASHAKHLWRLPAPCFAPLGHDPQLNGPRRHGVVTSLKSPQWGFLVDQASGLPYFVHQADVCGRRPLGIGQKVTFLPAQTPKGRKACEVRILSD
jgi:cold shock CspA family protein